MSRSIIIFVKNPELGKVKSRLAKSIGDKAALEVYIKLLQKTQSVVKDISAQINVYYSSFIEQNDPIWDEDSHEKKVQFQSPDLGIRMFESFADQLQQGHDKVLIIGSDCPLISEEIINSAFDSLEDNDIVIGPAEDGGYYLLGMKKANLTVFENIDWSTDLVFKQTIEIIKKLGLNYATLPMLPDIDYEEDWIKYGW